MAMYLLLNPWLNTKGKFLNLYSDNQIIYLCVTNPRRAFLLSLRVLRVRDTGLRFVGLVQRTALVIFDKQGVHMTCIFLDTHARENEN